MEKLSYNNYIKNYIIEALLILLKTKPYSEISVKEIVSKAGVGRATFYRNFKDKDDVLDYKFHEMSKDFIADTHLTPTTDEDFYYVFMKIFYLLKKHKDLMKNIFESNVDYIYFNFLNNSMSSFLKKMPAISNDYVYLGYAGALYNICKEWIKGDCKESMNKMIEALFMVIFGRTRFEKLNKNSALLKGAFNEEEN